MQQCLAVQLSCDKERLSLLRISDIFSSFAGIDLELPSFSVCVSLTFSLPPRVHSHSIQYISYSSYSIQFCVKSIFLIIKPT